MIPIGDDNTGHHIRPFITWILIAINIIVFVWLQGGANGTGFTYAFSTVPEEIVTGTDIAEGYLEPTPIPVYGTLITSMFMHGSYMHLGGNMLYLWVFGDNLENRMGHVKYLIFYLLTGIIASLAHVFVTQAFASPQQMLIPSLGASGAISGVLGGYLLLFPKGKVKVMMGLGISQVPAFVALGLWILLQVFAGVSTMGGEGGGVAYAAHVGGFVAGLILVKMFARPVTEKELSRR